MGPGTLEGLVTDLRGIIASLTELSFLLLFRVFCAFRGYECRFKSDEGSSLRKSDELQFANIDYGVLRLFDASHSDSILSWMSEFDFTDVAPTKVLEMASLFDD